jgi:diacylglycerol kinase family enzyme
MKNVNDLVNSEIKRGAKTIVAVGNDQTIGQVISAMAKSNIPFGVIPIEKKDNYIANALGVSDHEDACDILSARRIETIDLGRINDKYFISYVSIAADNLNIEVEKSYSIELTKHGTIYVVNMLVDDLNLPSEALVNPKDGLLQVVISASASKKNIFSSKKSDSVFSFDKLKISNQKDSILTEQGFYVSIPAEIEAMPSALKVIVGKSRKF